MNLRKVVWRLAFFWKTHGFWAFFLSIKDAFYSRIVNRDLIPLHKKLKGHLDQQKKDWPSMAYCSGYFYQGFLELGINGIKPTEKRIEKYGIKEYFDKDFDVFDIGSNNGFMVCYIARYVKNVEGVELNPYLVKISNNTKDFLNLDNVDFHAADFSAFTPSKKYDIVLSLSNHHTIDGNLDMDFEKYIIKIFDMLKNDGVLFFESHDINGDDRDMNEKFDIVEKYFILEKCKMVKKFFPSDIDKLFAVLRKRDNVQEQVRRSFDLDKYRHSYNY